MRGTGARLAVVAGVAVAIVLVATGVANVVGLVTHQSVSGSRSYSGVRRLVVDVDGTVTVRGSTGPASVQHRLRWSTARPGYTESLAAGTLTVHGSCPVVNVTFGCDTDVTVSVPPATPVDVRSSAGGVRLEGLRAAVSARTGSGTVRAHDVRAAQLSLRSSSGGVVGTELSVGGLTAHSGSGSVRLALTAEPEHVDATSSSGSVDVVLPRGPSFYRVDASSASGGVSVGVRTDPTGPRTIRARSGSGRVSVRYG